MNTVPTDSPSVFAGLNKLVLSKANLAIVRPDNPPPGIAGFVFSIVGEDGSDLESEITDHYTEENNSIQDHIGLRPETVTISGEIAEVTQATPTISRSIESNSPLPLIEGYLPTLSPGATAEQDQVVATRARTEAAITSSNSLYGFYLDHLPQQPNQTKQQVAYGYLYQLWKGRQLCSVETPWGFFTNMAIQSLSVTQGPTTRVVSEFTATFKKIRTVRQMTIERNYLVAGRLTEQISAFIQNGVIGKATPTHAQKGQFTKTIIP